MIDGTKIYNILSGLSITGYPLVADKGAKIPFAVYRRIDSDTTKDIDTELTYEIKFVAGTYSESLQLLNTFLDSQNYIGYEDGGEDYQDNYFINTIQVTI